ncbi:hypothetical protein [Scatolibacter rhodanostii]|uniref:hypothetical protein n=1 Tax=Scatolibacter rhodanostii TaxID=2014781 RepID=UPI000C07A59E|nr:hypothetical protein [Scatolibacter rhodanostii]
MNSQYPYKPYTASRRQNKSYYRRYTSYAILITLLAVVITIISLSLKKELGHQTTREPTPNYMDNYNAKNQASQEDEILEKAVIASETENESYKITIYDEKIAVFKNDENEPFLMTNILINHLPQEDIRMLEEGIFFDSYNHVRQFLEDFE